MNYLDKDQCSRLGRLIEKFPELKTVAWKLNQAGVSWGIAAGSATYIYVGGKEKDLDDVDIWIDAESKVLAAEALGQEWEPHASDRHQAENIALGDFDIFTNCRRIRGEQVLIDYRWTALVDEHLREADIEGIGYRVVSPEDVVALKMVNPREGDKKDVLRIKKEIDLDQPYLRRRLAECGVTVILE